MNPHIGAAEIALRHVPGGTRYQAPPTHRITSGNFLLRSGEHGVSVTRAPTSPDRLILLVKGNAESCVGGGIVQEIREIGYDVVPEPTPEDPQHSVIIAITGQFSFTNHCCPVITRITTTGYNRRPFGLSPGALKTAIKPGFLQKDAVSGFARSGACRG